MKPHSTDLQGNNRSGAPSCGHCGLPLATDVKVCPFCDRRVARTAPGGARIILGVPERTVLLVAAAILAVAGVLTAVAAFTA